MRILVAQMTRMGDTLQTTPLVRALRLRYPQAHIALMVRRLGQVIAERNPDVNEVIVYDEDEMFLDLRSRDSDRLLRAYQTAEGYVRRIRDSRFDVVYNCTHSIASAMLFKLANVPKVVGAHLSQDGQFVLRGGWTNYFFTSCLSREYNDLNLCDTFRHFLGDAPPCQGLMFQVTDEDRQAAASLLATHGVGPGDFLACLQIGASDDQKRWPEACFAELARLLVERRQAKVLLVGVREEAHLGEVFERHAPGVAAHLFGQTTLPVLAAVLERANVLVTNDTGTMHLAAAVKCPVVLISVGYVHFRETGPYGQGHCVLERRRDDLGRTDLKVATAEDREAIRPQQVLRALESLLTDEKQDVHNQEDDDADWSGVDVYLSWFAGDGCLRWFPRIRRPLAQMDFLRIAYRAMWLDFLEHRCDLEKERQDFGEILRYYTHGPASDVASWYAELNAVFAELCGLAERGICITKQLITVLNSCRTVRTAQGLVSELMQLDEEIRLFGELHKACKPLVLIARFERDNLEGADPLALAETTLGIYSDLLARSTLLQDKLRLMTATWEAAVAHGA